MQHLPHALGCADGGYRFGGAVVGDRDGAGRRRFSVLNRDDSVGGFGSQGAVPIFGTQGGSFDATGSKLKLPVGSDRFSAITGGIIGGRHIGTGGGAEGADE